MNPITKYDPFSRNFDDFFKGMFLRPVRLDLESMPELQIKLDITENGDTYQVSAEIPGVKKEDIKVSVEGNLVRISAESKKETDEKKGDQLLRSERYYGRLERAFTLDGDVDESRVDAKYADGVLKLKLPKKAASASRRITVN